MSASSVTWGIGSTEFLVGYASLALATLGALWLRRSRLLDGGGAPGHYGKLDEYELALLNGGPQLAITIAASKLHRRGSLVRSGRSLVTGRRPEQGAADLEHELYDAVQREAGITPRGLRRQLERCAAIETAMARLTEAGLLVGDATRRRIDGLWLWVLPVLGLGVARVVTAIEHDAASAYVLVMVCALAFAMALLASRRPRATRRGAALLEAERAGRTSVDRGTGQAGIPREVALYGAGALWALDPGFASSWSVAREQSWTSFGGGGGGACGVGGGGSSCGGGGGGGCGGGGS